MDIITIIQNSGEDEPVFCLLMSEKGFLCYRDRGREEEEEKQFYK